MAVISVSLILIAGIAASAALRTASAALRHYVLAIAIACAAASPLLSRIAPSWQLPGSAPVALAPGSGHIVAIDATTDGRAAEPAPSTTPRSGVDLRTIALAIWVFGAAVASFTLGIGLARLRRLRRRATALESLRWAATLDRLRHRYNVARPVELLQGERRAPIVTWGVVHARILVPAGAEDWPEARVEAVLAHELAHVQRFDWVAQMIAEALAAAYWFNPLVWIAARRLRQESEHACDDAVLATGMASVDYANELLTLTRASRRESLPAAAIARPSSLERRVRAMLNTGLNRTPTTRTAAVVALLAVVGLAISISGLGAAAQGFASFSGGVQDQVGRLIPKVSLTLTNAQNQAKYEVKTDATGHFEFVGLPPATYDLAVVMPGFSTLRATLTMNGRNAQDMLNLSVGSIEETVTVVNNGVAATLRRAGRQDGTLPKSRCADVATGGCIDPPVKIQDLPPTHPGIDGTIVMKGVLGSDGSVHDLQPVGSAAPAQAAAVVAAVNEWKFVPTRLDGVPVDVAITVTANFAAMPPPPPPPPPPQPQ